MKKENMKIGNVKDIPLGQLLDFLNIYIYIYIVNDNII